jgi:hypothetical protein
LEKTPLSPLGVNSTIWYLEKLVTHRIFSKFEGKKISSSSNPNDRCEEMT